MRVAGVMSGTSLDGIDVAIVEIRGRRVETIGFQSTPYAPSLRAEILGVSDAVTTTSALSRLNFRLGEEYARGGITVMFAMPPIFRATRPSLRSRNRR